MYPTFPVSPVPADLNRRVRWGGNTARYDSGAKQGLTPFTQPLYTYDLNFQNMNPSKRDLILTLINSVRGTVSPFWFPDPTDAVNSVMVVRSGITTGSVRVFDLNSFYIRPHTTDVATLFSSLSGFVSNGAEYSYNVTSGFVTVNTKAATDVWGARSLDTLLKKCSFTDDYGDSTRLFGIWNTGMRFEEIY